jgi:hypothetical protein
LRHARRDTSLRLDHARLKTLQTLAGCTDAAADTTAQNTTTAAAAGVECVRFGLRAQDCPQHNLWAV